MPQIDLGATLSRLFQLWWKNLLLFGAMAAMAWIAPLVLQEWKIPQPSLDELFQRKSPAEEYERLFWTLTLVLPCYLIALSLLMSGLTHAGLARLSGQRANPVKSLLAAVRWFPHSLLFVLFFYLGIFMCCVPGVVVVVLFQPYLAVAQTERKGLFGSFQRAYELTAGSRWVILALLLIVFVINLVLSLFGITQFFLEGLPRVAASLVWQSIFSPIPLLLQPVIYRQLIDIRMQPQESGLGATFE